MPTIIGLDSTAVLRILAHGIKSWRSFDSRSRLASVRKLVRCRCSLQQSSAAYSTMSSVIEGKRAAAYFAVDEYIQVCMQWKPGIYFTSLLFRCLALGNHCGIGGFFFC